MNLSNTWKGKLEAASFFCCLKICTGSVRAERFNLWFNSKDSRKQKFYLCDNLGLICFDGPVGRGSIERHEVEVSATLFVGPGGRHLVDIIGDISWTKEVTSRVHFW